MTKEVEKEVKRSTETISPKKAVNGNSITPTTPTPSSALPLSSTSPTKDQSPITHTDIKDSKNGSESGSKKKLLDLSVDDGSNNSGSGIKVKEVVKGKEVEGKEESESKSDNSRFEAFDGDDAGFSSSSPSHNDGFGSLNGTAATGTGGGAGVGGDVWASTTPIKSKAPKLDQLKTNISSAG